jgi:hypothetical protein
MPENILTHKLGPLPVIVWVASGASIIGVVLFLTKDKSGSDNTSSNNVSMLSPTEAEAFGTIEQQQQDVTNALTTVGQNQAALGGSLNTLSGSFAQQSAYENTQFGAIEQAQSTLSAQQAQDTSSLEQGQQDYFQSVIQNLQNMYSALSSQSSAQYQGLATQVNGDSASNSNYYNQIMQYLNNMQQGLGGSIGTSKAEILALAQGLNINNVQRTLTSRGDGTTS